MQKYNDNLLQQSQALIHQMNQTKLDEGMLAMWYLGQSGVALKSGSQIFYIDPYLSNYVMESSKSTLWERNVPIPLDPGTIDHADAVLISHHHDDHLDPVTLSAIAKASDKTLFICPEPHIPLLVKAGIHENRVVGAMANVPIVIGDTVVHPVAAAHEEYQYDAKGNHLYLGYILETSEKYVYHAGDTVVTKELMETLNNFKIDVGILPINGRDFHREQLGIVGNMDYREAVDLATDLKMEMLIPVHFDMFEINTVNPAFFVDYLYKNHPTQKHKILVAGERLIY